MKTLRGKVSGIRHTVNVSGSQGAVTTTHLAIFDLNGKPVQLEGDAVAINDNDEIEVAGDDRGGIFRALAYRNHTRQTTGTAAYLSNMILLASWLFGTAFLLIGLVLLISPMPTPVILGVPFTGVGLFLFSKASQLRRIRNELKKLHWSP
ncbi:MAG: hypothetical protein ACYC9J_13910 [Sulfuricaulis sp.]